MNPKNQPEKSEAVVGFFIRVSPEEERDLREFLKDNGYPEPPGGLKEFILDEMYGEEKEDRPEISLDPDKVAHFAMQAGTKISEILFGKKKAPARGQGPSRSTS